MDVRLELEKYVHKALKPLGLSHWDIRIIQADHDQQQDDTHFLMAEVVKASDRPCAHIIFYREFFNQDPVDQRHFVVHELLHLHVGLLFRHVERVREHLGAIAYSLYGEGARADMEELVDRLAYVIEAMVPLPSWHVS